MATGYSCSGNIRVFPSVGRGSYDYNARNLNEYTLSGIVNRMFGNASFVINENFTSFNNGNTLKFNIDGYYFELSSYPNGLDVGCDLYAAINISEYPVGGTEYYELSKYGAMDIENLHDENEKSPLDVGNIFYGIAFSNSEDEFSDNPRRLQLLEYDGDPGKYKVPEKSSVIFSASKIAWNDVVVDGELIKDNT